MTAKKTEKTGSGTKSGKERKNLASFATKTAKFEAVRLPNLFYTAFDVDDPIALHLVGGFNDTAGKAHKLSMRILGYFSGTSEDINFDLETCCLGDPNTLPGRRGPKIGK